jgi:nicotinate phosphoribosyltransferase
MSFEDELESFEAYAGAMPNNCIFLVDTYNTLEGVKHAVEVGKKLRAAGHRMLGIRLDSGDLAYLSIEARKILDAGGFTDAAILASNDLDEDVIRSLKEQGATIGIWGVGTRLVTAYDQAALGGVYKLSAIRRAPQAGGGGAGGEWEHKIKLSEQLAKTSIPGILQVRRYRVDGEYRSDMLFDELTFGTGRGAEEVVIVDPLDTTRRKAMAEGTAFEDLLVPIFRGGELVYEAPALEATRRRTQEQLAGFYPGILRAVHPHQYPVGLERGLFELRQRMILEARGVPV